MSNPSPTYLRNHFRAAWAFDLVDDFSSRSDSAARDLKIAVNALGPNIMRSGLAAAIAFLQRDKSQDAVSALLKGLACAKIPGIGTTTVTEFPKKVRELEATEYMLATREILKLTLWLKRAVQAQGNTST